MSRTFWQERWDTGRLGWHRDQAHPDIVAFAERELAAPKTVMMPLCGKSIDLCWLAENGHHAIGIEFVDAAAQALYSQLGRTPSVTEHDAATIYRAEHGAGSITFICADVFDVTPALFGVVDAVWDRAALVALGPDVRPRYVEHMRALAGDAPVLLNAFTYNQTKMDGPPFSVPSDEIATLYRGRNIEQIAERDVVSEIKFKDAGHTYWLTSTYRIQ